MSGEYSTAILYLHRIMADLAIISPALASSPPTLSSTQAVNDHWTGLLEWATGLTCFALKIIFYGLEQDFPASISIYS